MTLATADFKIAGHDHRHRPRAHRRSHDRQHAGDVPLPARGREDVGGGAGVRGGRPQVRAGRVRHRERESRGARAEDQGARPVGVGGGRRARRADARPRRAADRLHPHVDRARRTKAGCGWRSTSSRCRTPTSATPKLRQGNLRAKYRRHRLSARRSEWSRARSSAACRGTSRVPTRRRETTPNIGTVDTTDDMRGRHRLRRAGGAGEVRAGRGRADHRRRARRRCFPNTT